MVSISRNQRVNKKTAIELTQLSYIEFLSLISIFLAIDLILEIDIYKYSALTLIGH